MRKFFYRAMTRFVPFRTDHVYGAAHPESAKDFDEDTASVTGAHDAAVIASYTFAAADKIVDVRGSEVTGREARHSGPHRKFDGDARTRRAMIFT
jgi:hypothetical protein